MQGCQTQGTPVQCLHHGALGRECAAAAPNAPAGLIRARWAAHMCLGAGRAVPQGGSGGAAAVNAAAVRFEPCNESSSSQLWELERQQPGGFFWVRAAAKPPQGGLCVDSGGGSSGGRWPRMRLWPCDAGRPNQRFVLGKTSVPKPPPAPPPAPTGEGKKLAFCLCV